MFGSSSTTNMRAGHEVMTASDGAQGWAMLLAHRPDLAVLDVMLPALDGFELCRRIRAHETLRHARILMLSARGGQPEIEKSLQLGADGHLRKPFATREFLDTVANLLKSPS
jgi:DNA-binding response OmpR family regulator